METHRGREAAGRAPRSAIVHYEGIAHELDLAACRRALLRLQVDREVGTRQDLASRVGVSRSTLSRFLNGRRTRVGTVLAILDKLGLRFDDVARAVEPAREPDRG